MDPERTARGLRPDVDEYFLQMAELVGRRSTCYRRMVGCVLVDRQNHVMATGFNGVHKGARHCTEDPCGGASLPSGTGLDLCEAIHAEQNALLQCYDVNSIYTAYIMSAPCVFCMRMLANTSVRRIVFREEYPHVESQRIVGRLGIEWIHRPRPADVALSPQTDGG